MKNELAVRSWAYDDNLIRTVKLNEEAWFVGKDAAKALGYSNTRDALANHVDEEDKNTVAIRDVLKREQNTIIINESGLYSLIFGSKLETARQFKRWVTNEVLPAIRKTGGYAKPTNEAERAQRYLHQTNATQKAFMRNRASSASKSACLTAWNAWQTAALSRKNHSFQLSRHSTPGQEPWSLW